MAKPHLELVSPATVNRTVTTPLRRPNVELRTREYLTDAEVAKLTNAAKADTRSLQAYLGHKIRPLRIGHLLYSAAKKFETGFFCDFADVE
jgi:hypothetical protein